MDITRTLKGYELREEIGKGGFGVVYRAYQPIVERDVVIKVILPRYTNNPEFIRRFEAEAQIVAHLEHPHIVSLFDYWRDPQGAYLVMPWLRGGTLGQYLNRQEPELSMVLNWIDQITSALGFAHRRNVIHRDIKPANILLDEEGENAFLTDFGIAKKIDSGDGTGSEAGASGSIGYIAPEQLEGHAPLPQSDIYSLGIMLYEMLTSEHPYGNVSFSQMALMHLFEPLPEIHVARPDLPPVLSAVLQRATAKSPEARYQNVRDLALDVRQAMADSVVEVLNKRTSTELHALLNPYKGLRAFEEADADDFFGREALVEQLLARMSSDCFLAVVGPSGSGKSSVIYAGVVPALRQGKLPLSNQWFIVTMVPGAHPIENLHAALLSVAINPPADLLDQLQMDSQGLLNAAQTILPDLPDTDDDPPLMLIIDQFEEVFTQVEDEAERAHFLALLHQAVTGENSRLRLLCNLRADFYDKPLLYEGFGALMQERTQVVLPLTTDELHQAIRGPAERVGLRVDPDLTAQIVADLKDEPGILPLLQYALTELYERRDNNRLTLSAYEASGGVLGALARRAQEVYDSLPFEERETARQVFLRLVALGEGTEDTRRRVLLSELVAIAPSRKQLDDILGVFGKYRLLTFDLAQGTREPTVEVAHEAMIREWELLQKWLDESRNDIRLQRMLAAAATDWEAATQDASYLLRDARLSQYENWIKAAKVAITPKEQAYLDASIAKREQEAEAERERQAREIRQEHRTRTRTRLLGVAVLVAILGITLTAIAFWQYTIAKAAQEEANTAEQAAKAAALAGFAQQAFLLNNDTDLGLALAFEAHHFDTQSSLVRDVIGQIGLAPGTRRVYMPALEDSSFWLVDFSPDGKYALTGTYNQVAILWDVETGEIVHTLRGHSDDTVGAVDISPDGRMAATGSNDNAVILWDLETGKKIGAPLLEHRAPVWSVAFSADGTKLVSTSNTNGSGNETIIVWDALTGKKLLGIPTNNNILRAVFSPGGKFVASGSDTGEVTVWNVATGKPFRTYTGHTGEVWYLAFDPGGETFYSGVFTTNEERRFIQWEVATGQQVYVFEDTSTNSSLNAFALSTDGRFAAVALIDGSFKIWDLRQQRIIHTFTGHTDTIYGLAFSPDGEHIFSASIDGTARLWDLYNGAQVNQIILGGISYALAVHPSDPNILLIGLDNGQVVWWDVQQQQVIRSVQLEGIIWSVAFSPDGQLVAVASSNNTTCLLDAMTGEIKHTLNHTASVTRVSFSPNGQSLLAGDEGNQVILWDAHTGEQVEVLSNHISPINAVVISPDGQTAATGADAGDFDQKTFIIWDMGQRRARFVLNPGSLEALAFSPDSHLIAVGLSGGGLEIWDASTGMVKQTFQGHSSSLETLAFSPDGKLLLSGSGDRTLILWDVETGEQHLRFYGHTNAITSAVFSLDGQTIFSSSFDGTIRQWQILKNANLVPWVESNRYIRALTCSEGAFYQLDEAGC